MRTIVLGGIGATVYAAGAGHQELKIRDNTRAAPAGGGEFILMADGASRILMVNATDRILLAP